MMSSKSQAIAWETGNRICLGKSPAVAEAAANWPAARSKGQAIHTFVMLRSGFSQSAELLKNCASMFQTHGPIARPKM